MGPLLNRSLIVSVGLCILFLFLAATPSAAEGTDVVEVTAVHDHEADRHLFRISNQKLASGWTTFQFSNASPVDHFLLIWQYPEEGITAAREAGQPLLDHWYDNVAGSFEGFTGYLEGRITLEAYTEQLVASLETNAPWFLDPGATPVGGAGFTSPGGRSATTVLLEPGDYIVECYIRDDNGVFHTAAGMLDHLRVDERNNGAEQPSATARIIISTEGGIEVEAAPKGGPNVVEIHFRDQTVYPHFLGHNVQLVRLNDQNDEAVLTDLAQWMDWRHPDGLVNRAPDGARFVGGVMEMSAGASGYLHVNLEPGDYAWIAEVPDPAAHGMLKTFSIAD